MFFTTAHNKRSVNIINIRVFRTLDELITQAYTVWKDRYGSNPLHLDFSFDDFLKDNNIWFGTKDQPPRRLSIAELRAIVEAKGY